MKALRKQKIETANIQVGDQTVSYTHLDVYKRQLSNCDHSSKGVPEIPIFDFAYLSETVRKSPSLVIFASRLSLFDIGL